MNKSSKKINFLLISINLFSRILLKTEKGKDPKVQIKARKRFPKGIQTMRKKRKTKVTRSQRRVSKKKNFQK